MELLVNDRLLRYAEEHPLPSLNGSGCLLAEFYFDVRYSYAERMLSALQEKGYRIVLAHPERYAFIRQDPERARELADNGVILQLNKGSFFREFGERSYHAAGGSSPGPGRGDRVGCPRPGDADDGSGGDEGTAGDGIRAGHRATCCS